MLMIKENSAILALKQYSSFVGLYSGYRGLKSDRKYLNFSTTESLPQIPSSAARIRTQPQVAGVPERGCDPGRPHSSSQR